MITRAKYIRLFYLAFIVFFILRIFDEYTLTQVNDCPIMSPRVDFFIWSLHGLGIKTILQNNLFALLLDGLVIGIPFVILFLRDNVYQKKLIIAHSLLFFFYVAFIYMFPGLSLRKYIGLVLVPIAFWFGDENRYRNSLDILRYYVCFIFVSSASWKFVRGGLFQGDQMMNILKNQHLKYFVNFEEGYSDTVLNFLIAHPFISQVVLWLGFVLQIAFVIGFFTKKYDRLLFTLLVVFICSDYLFMRIEYWEFIVFSPLFLFSKK